MKQFVQTGFLLTPSFLIMQMLVTFMTHLMAE